ncbi:unnamed protein product [Phaedon cochleariae]|uniref:protein-tyrosine-phosphatase n=1 Tax=Phaedon cochleariae TaxID=80249 RepID=A0A9P0GU39_PHACE|nr:unnamed protein product [Phaedon cochleariae]
MGVKLQHILGIFLIFQICSATGSSTSSESVDIETNDTKINQIEKLPKTNAELNTVDQENTQKKVDDDPEHIKTTPPTHTTEQKSNNFLVKEDNKENFITQDSSSDREDKARAIDIQKFISPEFQNNVYSYPVSSDTEKYSEGSFHKSTTNTHTDYSKFELTTPKTHLFDKKYEEARQKLEQEYEENAQDINSHDEDEEPQGYESHEALDDEEPHMDKISEDPVPESNSTLDYKEQINISKDNVIEKNSNQNSFTIEQVKKVLFSSIFNDTSTFGYDSKEDTVSPKPLIHPTEKSITLTKPTANKNNSHILSNKIESETIKAIGTEATTEKEKMESKEQIVEENRVIESETIKAIATEATTEKQKMEPKEQLVEENKVIESETIKAIDTEATTEKQKMDPKEQVVEENRVIESETIKTIGTEATTEKQKLEPREQRLIPVNATTERDATTAVDVDSTTLLEELTTPIVIPVTTEQLTETTQFTTDEVLSTIDNSEPTTTEGTTQFITTADGESSTEETTTEAAETTHGIPVTATSARVSKGMTMEEPQSTEAMTVTTTEAEPIDETTTDLITTELPQSTIEDTTPELPELTTTRKGISTTETSVTNETLVPSTVSFPVTTIEFIHVETRDNHTTLVPDTLSPNLSYPTTNNESSASNDTGRTGSEPTTTAGTTEDNSESAESSASTDSTTLDNPDDSKGKIIAIVISSVGAVCLILLAGLLYVMRKRQNRFNYKQRCRPVNLDDYSVDNISVYNSVRRKAERQSKRSYGNPAFDDPVAVTHPLNFPALAKFSANNEDIRAEFEEIPQISAKTSELPQGCETKNRYANVIPLPETRVFLQPIDGYRNSDYINANFVTGPKNTRGYYIATQAPMEDTVDDFWRMIWEQQSKVILMITLLFENGVEKSVDYLPPSEVLDCHRLFGDFQVTLKRRDVKEKYVISSLQLKNMVSNSWREITHFWYLGWPEKGVPNEGNSLIAFLIEARSFMKSSTIDKNHVTNGSMNGTSGTEVNPVVVHCSPGTGRTGVVITCDIAIREFEQTRLVDIPKIVYRIRRDRAGAVQTKEQYNFIYKVVSLYATKLTGGSLDSF